MCIRDSNWSVPQRAANENAHRHVIQHLKNGEPWRGKLRAHSEAPISGQTHANAPGGENLPMPV